MVSKLKYFTALYFSQDDNTKFFGWITLDWIKTFDNLERVLNYTFIETFQIRHRTRSWNKTCIFFIYINGNIYFWYHISINFCFLNNLVLITLTLKQKLTECHHNNCNWKNSFFDFFQFTEMPIIELFITYYLIWFTI